MQDNIPDALIAAFERHYDCSWNDPALRNERLAWRAAWAEATKPCLHQIQEPAADIWPCANIDVDEHGLITSGKMYAPGFPAGNHDVYPVRVPYMDEHTEAWLACSAELQKALPGFMHLSNMNGIECAVAAIRELANRAAPQAAPAAAAVPDGWKLVPIDPIQQMEQAAADYLGECVKAWGLWKAMIESAPACAALAATPAAGELATLQAGLQAAAPVVPKWIDDPHDIEQGQMLNPEWVRQQQPAIMPKGESAAAQLRAMATNYPSGHGWDKLDAKACIRGALEIKALRALLAGVAAPSEWEKVRRGLTMVMLGLAGRPDCSESAIEAALDAVTEPGMPLAGLRALPATAGQAQACIDWDELPEDSKERARFNRNLGLLYGGDPRVSIATALSLWANTPSNGELGLMCAIFANEVAKLHIAPQAQAQADARHAEQYRLLQRGQDTVQADDEFLREDGVTWRKDPSGIFVGMIYEGNILLPARRAIAAQAAAKEGAQQG